MKNADPRAADRPAGSRLPCGPIPTTPYRLPVGWFSGAYYHNPISAACGLVFCGCIISGSLTIKRPLRSGGLTTPGAPRPNFLWGPYMGGRNGVSKGIEDGHETRGCFRGGPTGRATCDHFLSSWTPHAVCPCRAPKES